MKNILNFSFFFQFFHIRHVYSTISLNCLQTLNTSDCNETPSNVFSYYKPGSRCELEVWRGCPTGNKFDTEEDCSEACIFKAFEFERKGKSNAKCLSPEDLTNCKENATHGFKYDDILIDCVEVNTNCPGNIFEEKLECIQTCVRDLTFNEKIKLLSTQQSRELDSILESFGNSTAKGEESIETTIVDEPKTSNDGNTDSDTKATTVFTAGGGSNETPVTKGEEKQLKGDDQNITTPNDVKLKGDDQNNTTPNENKLAGDDHNATTPIENKVPDSNGTSAGNETVTVKNEGTTVAIEKNANITSNSTTQQHDTTEKVVTTMKVGTQKEVEIA